MSDGPWSRLATPFPPAAVRWHAVDRSADGDRLRLAPHVAAEALRARLDEAAGPDGWSLRMTPWDAGRVVAELTVHVATRAAVAHVVAAPELSLDGAAEMGDAGVAATAAALGAAAALFGAVPPVRVDGDGWVDADPATGDALFPPEYAVSGGVGDGTEPISAPGRGASEGTRSAAVPANPPGSLGGNAEVKREGQQMIDRLVTRLREEGMGAEAARLVTVYGGYGRDAAAQRELYAKLRALLVERSART
jgi:hypothetical protein